MTSGAACNDNAPRARVAMQFVDDLVKRSIRASRYGARRGLLARRVDQAAAPRMRRIAREVSIPPARPLFRTAHALLALTHANVDARACHEHTRRGLEPHRPGYRPKRRASVRAAAHRLGFDRSGLQGRNAAPPPSTSPPTCAASVSTPTCARPTGHPVVVGKANGAPRAARAVLRPLRRAAGRSARASGRPRRSSRASRRCPAAARSSSRAAPATTKARP